MSARALTVTKMNFWILIHLNVSRFLVHAHRPSTTIPTQKDVYFFQANVTLPSRHSRRDSKNACLSTRPVEKDTILTRTPTNALAWPPSARKINTTPTHKANVFNYRPNVQWTSTTTRHKVDVFLDPVCALLSSTTIQPSMLAETVPSCASKTRYSRRINSNALKSQVLAQPMNPITQLHLNANQKQENVLLIRCTFLRGISVWINQFSVPIHSSIQILNMPALRALAYAT